VRCVRFKCSVCSVSVRIEVQRFGCSVQVCKREFCVYVCFGCGEFVVCAVCAVLVCARR
jgi:hypothetical protein